MRSPSLIFVLAALFVGCGGDDSGNDPTTVDASQSLCGAEDRGDIFTAGMSKRTVADQFTIELVEADPAPPDRGMNNWSLRILDASGDAVEASSFRIKPWMPDHGHGSNPLYQTPTPSTVPGLYRLENMDLFMAGFWEFNFEIEAGAITDEAKLGFCIEG